MKKNLPNPLVAAVMILAVLIAYLPALKNGYIWDDPMHVTENALLFSFEGLKKIWTEPGSFPQYYPVTLTVLWIEHALWGLNPFGFHLANILLHGFNALLLWILLQRLAVPSAFFVSAAFAFHPVHVESVAWISELKNTLSCFFYLISFLCYAKYSFSEQKRDHNHRKLWYILAITVYILAVLSKTVACSLPAAALLIVFWKKERVTWNEIRPLIPMFIIGLALGINTILMEKLVAGAQGVDWDFSIIDRFLIAGRALWFYIQKLVFPFKLSFIYPRWEIDALIWWQYLFPLSILLVISLLWAVRKKIGKGPLTAMLFFCGTLLPALGFIDTFPMKYSFVADHFQYIASIGMLALIIGGIDNLLVRLSLSRKTRISFFSAALLFLSVLTWNATFKYKDVETLWKDTLVKNPSSWMAHNNLGLALLRKGNLDTSISHFLESIRLYPENYDAFSNLGIAYARKGQLRQAVNANVTAVKLAPRYKKAHINMANAYARSKEFDLAAAYYKNAITFSPEDARLHNHAGIAFYLAGRLEDANFHFLEAIRIKPAYFNARINLGNVYFRKKLFDKAFSHYSYAVSVNPNVPSGYGNLGLLAVFSGNIPVAVTNFAKMVSIDAHFSFQVPQWGTFIEIPEELIVAIQNYKKTRLDIKNHNKAIENFEKSLDYYYTQNIKLHR